MLCAVPESANEFGADAVRARQQLEVIQSR